MYVHAYVVRFKCSNKGYAFVNFTTDVAAARICKYLHNTTWAAYGTKKICEITGARIQVTTPSKWLFLNFLSCF